MELALLVYNIFLTAIFTLAIACAYYLFARRKNASFAAAGLIFVLYLLDNTVVLCTEILPWFSRAYDAMFISTPSFKTVYFVGLLACLTTVYLAAMRPRSHIPFYGVLAFYAVLLICIPLVQDPQWMVWLYYLPTQLFLVGLAVCGLAALRHQPQRYDQQFYRAFRRVLIFLLVMGLAILAEDTLVIFQFDAYGAGHTNINNRSWTENILFIGLAFYLIRYTISVLSRAELLVSPVHATAKASRRPEAAFGLTYGLTERECAILVHLLSGESPQQISDDLTIAPGTVKTHIHNIYQKMEVTKREQLMAKYQKFAEEQSRATMPQD